MKRIIMAALILLPVFLFANLRAPYIVKRNGGSNIKIDVPVIVESETLNFHYSGVYSGKIGNVMEQEYSARVTAVYNLSYDKDVKCTMNFIAPSSESVLVKVNDTDCEFNIKSEKSDKRSGLDKDPEQTVDTENPPSEPAKEKKRINLVYTILFDAVIKAGMNTVSVEYTQPLGKHEVDYGYFKKSRWSTDAEYIFGPIASWKRAETFNALITVQIPCDWAVTEIFFGPAYKISLLSGKIIGNEFEKIDASPPVRTTIDGKNYLTQSANISGEIPEMLFIKAIEQ